MTRRSRLNTPIGTTDADARFKRRPQTMVVLGDSLTEQGGEITANPDTRWASAWTWAQVLLGQPFLTLGNHGIGGQTTAQIRARLAAVIALKPGWVHLLCGTNNMGVANGVADAKSDITAMLDALEAAGVRVVLGTIPPRTGASYTGTQKADTLALNEWIRAQGRLRSLIVVDYFAALADGTTSNYQATLYGANPTADGVHLSPTGGYACGKILANALAPFVTKVVPYSSPTPGANLLGNPRPGLAASGATAPTGWTLGGASSGSVVWSDVARADGMGVWKQVVVPNDGVFTMNSNFTLDTTRLAVGDKVVGVLEFDVSALAAAGSNGTKIALAVKAWNGSSFFSTRYTMNTTGQPIDSRAGVLRTPPWALPAGTTIAALFLEVTGGMTLKIDRAGLYNLRDYAVEAIPSNAS